MRLLDGMTAIVTGGAGGIGFGIARVLLENGAVVVVTDKDPEKLRRASDDLNEYAERLAVMEADVGEERDCRAVARRAWEMHGTLDVLVNNAGIIRRRSTEQTTITDWEMILRVNLTGNFLMTKAVLPLMRHSGGGSIVNISSRAAKRPHRNATPAYGASKAGILYLTRHLALEYAADNIRVNAICPGPIETDMFYQLDEEKRAQTIKEIPLGRLGQPYEIGYAVLFLASRHSEFITGEVMHVNGGSFMD